MRLAIKRMPDIFTQTHPSRNSFHRRWQVKIVSQLIIVRLTFPSLLSNSSWLLCHEFPRCWIFSFLSRPRFYLFCFNSFALRTSSCQRVCVQFPNSYICSKSLPSFVSNSLCTLSFSNFPNSYNCLANAGFECTRIVCSYLKKKKRRWDEDMHLVVFIGCICEL